MKASGSFLPHFRQFGSVRRSFQGTGGRFELEGLTVGTWSIAARAPNRVASEGRVLRIPGELADVIELVVPRAGRIEGSVELEGGGSLRASWVRVADGKGGDAGGVMADAAGSFRLDGVPPGRVRVQAFDQGLVSASTPVEVRAEETSRVELSLSKGTELRARVVDASGASIDVEAVELLDPGGDVIKVGSRGEDGTYGLGIVPFGKHRVRARHGGKTYEQEVSAGGDELTVELLVD